MKCRAPSEALTDNVPTARLVSFPLNASSRSVASRCPGHHQNLLTGHKSWCLQLQGARGRLSPARCEQQCGAKRVEVARQRAEVDLHQEKELHIWSQGRVPQLGLQSQGDAVSWGGHLTRCLSAWHLNPGQEIKSKNDRGFYLLLRYNTTTGISTTTRELQS